MRLYYDPILGLQYSFDPASMPRFTSGGNGNYPGISAANFAQAMCHLALSIGNLRIKIGKIAASNERPIDSEEQIKKDSAAIKKQYDCVRNENIIQPSFAYEAEKFKNHI